MDLIRNGSHLLNFGGEIAKPIMPLIVNVDLYFRFNTYTRFPIKFTKNFCNELNWGRKDYKPDLYVGVFYKTAIKYSNAVRACPYQV